jgi:hypothetical protein
MIEVNRFLEVFFFGGGGEVSPEAKLFFPSSGLIFLAA